MGAILLRTQYTFSIIFICFIIILALLTFGIFIAIQTLANRATKATISLNVRLHARLLALRILFTNIIRNTIQTIFHLA